MRARTQRVRPDPGTCDMKGASDSRPEVVIQPELYRIREAAAVLSVSERTLYALIESGTLPAVRLPTPGTTRPPVRIARADLLAFVARCRGVSA